MAEGNARAIDVADDGGASGDFGHLSGFAEAEFTDVLAEVAIAGEFPHPPGFPSGELAEWKEGGIGGCWHNERQR